MCARMGVCVSTGEGWKTGLQQNSTAGAHARKGSRQREAPSPSPSLPPPSSPSPPFSLHMNTQVGPHTNLGGPTSGEWGGGRGGVRRGGVRGCRSSVTPCVPTVPTRVRGVGGSGCRSLRGDSGGLAGSWGRGRLPCRLLLTSGAGTLGLPTVLLISTWHGTGDRAAQRGETALRLQSKQLGRGRGRRKQGDKVWDGRRSGEPSCASATGLCWGCVFA